MGTRHLICGISDNQLRIAQYGQWDGYPSGQGISILEFLRSNKVNALKNNLQKCSWVSDNEYKNMWKEIGIDLDKCKGSVGIDDSDRFKSLYPQFSRDQGANILNIVSEAANGIKLRDDYEFAKDSLFCEWAYVIDFDKNTFEVYEGFNTMPLNESDRFYSDDLVKYKSIGDTYYPVRIKATFSLSDLPSDEEFLHICEPSDEEGFNDTTVDDEITEVEEKESMDAIIG